MKKQMNGMSLLYISRVNEGSARDTASSWYILFLTKCLILRKCEALIWPLFARELAMWGNWRHGTVTSRIICALSNDIVLQAMSCHGSAISQTVHARWANRCGWSTGESMTWRVWYEFMFLTEHSSKWSKALSKVLLWKSWWKSD